MVLLLIGVGPAHALGETDHEKLREYIYEADFDDALELAERLITQGDPAGLDAKALLLHEGFGTAKDENKAAQLLKLAVEKGFGPAMALVLCGDTPLLGSGTLRDLLATHRESAAAATVLSALLDHPAGYGRILRGPDGEVRRIVEHKGATGEERRVREINSGLFAFSLADLFEALAEVRADNAQGEYYLTDTLEILLRRGRRVVARVCRDPREVLGVNTLEQLREVEAIMQERLRHA